MSTRPAPACETACLTRASATTWARCSPKLRSPMPGRGSSAPRQVATASAASRTWTYTRRRWSSGAGPREPSTRKPGDSRGRTGVTRNRRAALSGSPLIRLTKTRHPMLVRPAQIALRPANDVIGEVWRTPKSFDSRNLFTAPSCLRSGAGAWCATVTSSFPSPACVMSIAESDPVLITSGSRVPVRGGAHSGVRHPAMLQCCNAARPPDIRGGMAMVRFRPMSATGRGTVRRTP